MGRRVNGSEHIYVLNATPNGRYALPAIVYIGLVGTAYILEDRNGAGTQELRLGFGTGRYYYQFLIPLAISRTRGTRNSKNSWHHLCYNV